MVFVLIQISLEQHIILRIYIDLSVTYTKNILPDLIYNFLRQHGTVDDEFTKLSINSPFLLQNCQHMIPFDCLYNSFVHSSHSHMLNCTGSTMMFHDKKHKWHNDCISNAANKKSTMCNKHVY